MIGKGKTGGVVRKAFGWGGSMALVRMVCSFISIKITAVYLGPSGLALIAQLVNFIGMFQSVLGQGLVAGVIRLSSEYGEDAARRRAVYATALRMGLVMAAVLGVVLAVASPMISGWLLTDSKYAVLIAISGFAVAAAMMTDVLQGTLGASKEIGLIGISTILATVMGLFVFAPLSYFWGIPGGLTATIIVIIVSSAITAFVLNRKSRHVKLSEFIGPFDRTEFGKILKFYPMLIVNGFLPPLVLIMVRDTLTANLSLHSAGLWQATWRLSEAYQAIIISSVSLYFMPSLGERAGKPFELKAQITKTFLTVCAVTAVFALSIFVLREQIVHIIFGKGFGEVSGLMPLQLLGDVLKMGGWILGMALVGTVRTHWFIFATALTSAAFVGITKFLVPSIGIHGALEAYVWSGIVQIAVGAFALRDILLLQPRPLEN